MHRNLLLASVLALAACATPAERAAQAEAEVDEMVEVYGPACERLGYKRDEDKWRQCVLHLADKAERRYSYYPYSTTCFAHRGFYRYCDPFW
jgi:hypothetical protein